MSVCPPVRPHGITRLQLCGFSWNFIFEYFSEIFPENSSFIKTGITGTVLESQYTFMITSRSVLRMRNVSDKIGSENQNTYFISKNFFFEYRAVYEIMWKHIIQPNRPQMTVRRMRFACWKPTATNAHSEHVTHIAFPLQQW